MNITDLKVKGGNFAMVLNGSIADDKLQAVVDDGISYIAERGGLSKVFKGVKDRKTVAFSVDMAKTVEAKMKEAFKGICDDLSVAVSAREWSEGAGGAQAKAQAAYDEMLKLNLPIESALAVAKAVHAGFVPAAKTAEVVAPTLPEQDPEVPMEG